MLSIQIIVKGWRNSPSETPEHTARTKNIINALFFKEGSYYLFTNCYSHYLEAIFMEY
jgi:hypothetical protein